jgi:hypothetical protein
LSVLLSGFLLRINADVGLPGMDTKKPSKPKYLNEVPNKFDPDGNVQPFPGNTILCRLSNSSDLYTSLLFLYDKLQKSSLSHIYALLPPSSWHMTVFEGVVDKKRKPDTWPSNLALDAPLDQCTALFKDELSDFDLQTGSSYHLSVVDLAPLKTGITLRLKPLEADNKALRGLRNRLADLLRIRARGHDQYGFHLGLGYLLRHLSDDQKAGIKALFVDHFQDVPKEFELGPPEFCVFKNMVAFETLSY